MEDTFSLTWEDSGAVVQNEEVIYGTEETEILPGQTEEFQGSDVVVSQNGEEVQDDGNIMYFTDDNVLVMQEANQNNFPEHFMDCQVNISLKFSLLWFGIQLTSFQILDFLDHLS